MKALVVGTSKAIGGLENGASLRIRYISNLLRESGFEVEVECKEKAKDLLISTRFNLVVLSSYSCSSLGRIAKQRSDYLWFDPYDSWLISRLSLAKAGGLIHVPLLLRDIFKVSLLPKRDITTFISRHDAEIHRFFLRKDNLIIMPIQMSKPLVMNSLTPRFVFVGDGSYLPNQKALPFLEKVARLVGTRVFVIGDGYKNTEKYTSLEFLGYLDSQEMYASHDIHLVPISSGAGIKTKAALPLSVGIRVIANGHSTRGLKMLPNLLVANGHREFATHMLNAMADKQWEYAGVVDSVYIDDEVDRLLSCLKKMTLR